MKEILLRGAALIMFLLLTAPYLIAQGPTSLPGGTPEPLPFTLPNILIFIVTPVLLFIFYIWWLKQKRKEREQEMIKRKEQEDLKDQSKDIQS